MRLLRFAVSPRPQPVMPASISAHYAALVAAGEIERDPAQAALIARLAQLNERLHAPPPPRAAGAAARAALIARLAQLNERLAAHRLARKSSSLGWLFGRRERSEDPLKGLYI